MDKSSKPIIEHITDFLDYIDIEKGLSNNTQENYSRFLKKFTNWLNENNLKDLKPHELTTDHIWQYRVSLSRQTSVKSKNNLKRSTQNYYLIALRSLLAYFADRDITSLPSDKIKLAKDKNEKTVNFLDVEQIEKLLLTPNTSNKIGLRDKVILETLFSTGLRVAELTALNLDQFKIKNSTADLELVITGKGGRPRTVYFSERAVRWLKKYLDSRTDTDKALFINYRPGSDKSNNSRRLTKRSVEDVVRKYTKIAGLPLTTTPHTLRHSYATDLLTKGVDLKIVQEFLGHKSVATTQIYTHVTSKHLRDIHRKFHSGKNLKN